MNESETNSGAAALPYRIQQQYLGEVRDREMYDDLEGACRFAGGDFALELKGERLHLFRVLVREVTA